MAARQLRIQFAALPHRAQVLSRERVAEIFGGGECRPAGDGCYTDYPKECCSGTCKAVWQNPVFDPTVPGHYPGHYENFCE